MKSILIKDTTREERIRIVHQVITFNFYVLTAIRVLLEGRRLSV